MKETGKQAVKAGRKASGAVKTCAMARAERKIPVLSRAEAPFLPMEESFFSFLGSHNSRNGK